MANILIINSIVIKYVDPAYTGLPTKDETSETIVRNFFGQFPCTRSGFLVGQNWLISVLNHYVNHQNTQLNAKTKN